MFQGNLFKAILSKIKNRKKDALESDLNRADRLIDEGNKLEDAGNYSGALSLYSEAIALAPISPRAYINKGVALHSCGEADLAMDAYLKALEYDSSNASANFNLGNIWQERMNFESALRYYNSALSAEPEFMPALVARGNVLGDMGRHDEAKAAYEQVLNIRPGYFEVRRNLVMTLMTLSRPLEALANCKLIINQAPPDSRNHIMLANVQRETGAFKAATENLKLAQALDPDSAEVCSYLCFVLMHQSDVALCDLMQTHWEFGRLVDHPRVLRSSIVGDAETRRRLNIGIVSADIRRHSVVNFFEPVFLALTKMPELRIFIYNNYDGADEVTQRFKNNTECWIDVNKLNSHEFCDQVMRDHIDVLIDLSGHTPGNRLEDFGKRISPLQFSWIGYPGTTGMKTMDYYIGDPHFLPHGDFDNQFSEKIIRLPAMAPFSMSNDLPDVNLLPALGNGFITFGSFNRIEKLNMAVIGLWAQLLNALPTSRMVVGAIPDDGVLADLSQKFKSLGVDLNRIHFKKRTGTHEYMKLHWDVDVCLDTFPYGGSTTTIHALSMGVPTLTVVGKTPIACAGRAILSALKLGDEFVAANESDFVAKGVSLTSRLQDLAALRSSLRERLCRADLMRGEMIAEAFASAARYAWTRWCKNEAAVDFDVVERNGEFEIRC